MQPQNNPQTGFNLPPVAPEQVVPMVPQEGLQTAPEAAPVAPEFSPNPQAGMPATQAAMLPPQQPLVGQNPLAAVVPQTTPTAAAITTTDTDLIEKEWVNKAKRIVESTKEDPHQQSKQLSGLKADYHQKRYSKEIKQGE